MDGVKEKWIKWGFEWTGIVGILHDGGPDSRKGPSSPGFRQACRNSDNRGSMSIVFFFFAGNEYRVD